PKKLRKLTIDKNIQISDKISIQFPELKYTKYSFDDKDKELIIPTFVKILHLSYFLNEEYLLYNIHKLSKLHTIYLNKLFEKYDHLNEFFLSKHIENLSKFAMRIKNEIIEQIICLNFLSHDEKYVWK